jgi:ATP-dependent exoDNAse (exonuclease V) alpha subunit
MRQAQALAVMLNGSSVFLTGAPGAGKTYLLNEFICRARAAGKTVAVTASTGIAATHIGGTTIHSWSGLGIRDRLEERDKRALAANPKLIKRYNATDVLVIDEVSMLHGQRLDMVNEASKLLRRSREPFGGLQVVLVGDLFQLPPVSRGSSDFDFVHQSAAWEELSPKICYLTEQHRQTSGGLLDFLEAMRRGDLQDFHHELLQERIGAQPNPDQPVTKLYAHNIDIDTINQKHLADISGPVHRYEMQVKGREAKVEQIRRSVLAPEVLELKAGAEVMFVANNPSAGYVNGSRGQITGFEDGQPVVKINGGSRKIKVSEHDWKLEEDGKVRAEVSQLPLRLAWAITIHKSQGMSLDSAEIDLSRSFTPGMGYVALSRVRSLNGLYLRGINGMALQLHPQIHDLDDLLREASAELAAVTADAPAQADKPAAAQPDSQVLSALKAWRLQRASADNLPAYVIAHDSVLELVAVKLPATAGQLLALKGFGPAKVDKYGADILQLITKHSA